MKKMILFGFMTLALALASAAALTQAQTQPLDSRLFTGADIAFRVDGVDAKGNLTGRLIVRVKDR